MSVHTPDPARVVQSIESINSHPDRDYIIELIQQSYGAESFRQQIQYLRESELPSGSKLSFNLIASLFQCSPGTIGTTTTG